MEFPIITTHLLFIFVIQSWKSVCHVIKITSHSVYENILTHWLHTCKKELSGKFCEHCRPYLPSLDNGPSFTSEEFQFLLQEWSIGQRTSSLHYLQSNGLTESMMKAAKSRVPEMPKIPLAFESVPFGRFCQCKKNYV